MMSDQYAANLERQLDVEMEESMTAKHTPGPWIAASRISSVVGLPIVTSTGRLICDVNHVRETLHEKVAGDRAFNREAIANAALIAAAPEMLEALRAINVLTSPGTRTLDEMIRDMGYANGWARRAAH